MNSTPTSKLVNSKYKSIVKQQVRSWRKNYDKYLTTYENFIIWSYDIQERTFKEIATDIANVAICKDDVVTDEAIRQAYHRIKAKREVRS